MEALYGRMDMEQMGALLHCSKRTVREWLAGHGIEIRTKGQVQGEQARPADEKRSGWQPRCYIERLRISYWRLCILTEQCPFMCPDDPCENVPARPDDGRSGCPMYNRLKNMGELMPRAWEGNDPWEYWRRLAEQQRARDIMYEPDDLDDEGDE